MTRRLLQCPSPRFSAGQSAVACALFLLIAFAAHAQQPQPAPNAPPVAQAPQAPPAPTAPRQKEGFFDALGRWWDKSMSDFKTNVDEQNAKWRELGEKTNQAAKEAGDAIAKIPGTRVVEGRHRCEIAANGSPDCNAAAEAMCRGKGFGAGRSLDIQSARKCSARSWLTGNPQESDCTTETIVTKAACQ